MYKGTDAALVHIGMKKDQFVKVKKKFILGNMYKKFILLKQNQNIHKNEWLIGLCFFYQNVLLVTKAWIVPNAALSLATEKIVKVLATVI